MFRKISPVFLFLLVSVSALADDFRFAFIGSESSPAYAGAQQGLTESNLQGQFLNQRYQLDLFENISDIPEQLDSYLAIFAAVDAENLRQISQIASLHPVFNLSSEDDELRTTCLSNALHILPSTKMKHDAVAQWRQKNPAAQVNAYGWHKDFVKFAARDLNKRFEKSSNTAMDEQSWAGWAAIKMTSDTVARENINNSAQMLSYLKNELSFDGQKGLDMNFRHTGQLRQPLLLVEDDKLLGEAPVRGVSNDIDSLGFRECDK